MADNELITLKLRSKTNSIIEIQVTEIIEIDGRPYQSAGDFQSIVSMVNHLSGRVATLEAIISQKE